MKYSMDGGGCFPTGRHYPGIAHLVRVAGVGLAGDWDAATQMSDLPLVCIDTETTGRDAALDRVIEVGLVWMQGGEVTRRQSWLINPERSISAEAIAVHGIDEDQVNDQRTFAEVAPELIEALRGAIPVAYNAEFDRDFLMAELGRTELGVTELPPALQKSVEWLDPLVWARELLKDQKSKALREVCSFLGVELVRAHRATDDAEAAIKVLHRFTEDVRVPKTYAAFLQEQRRLARLFEEERVRWRN